MPDRSRDWLNQAVRDLEQGRDSADSGRHEWACFAAHGAAEKAVTGMHLHQGRRVQGHAVARLLRELPPEVTLPDDMVDKAHVLDGFYVPTRYPNGHPEGAPFQHYGRLQSQEALCYASEIVAFARAQMA